MKRIVVGLLAVCLIGSLTVLANEDKATTEKSVKRVELVDVTATGKLAKQGSDFTVTEADGTVVKVMAPKAVKGEEAPAVDLAKLVGKDVKVAGKGKTKTSKDGKKTVSIKVVTSAEEAAAPAAPAAAAAPAEAPAAPVAAPEAK
ncbi:MAG: hypothetical protein PHW60_13030 [Kiritimatiellae bacterium]|nr:hypothetical protein [Kiritimatiellia bacterium]